MVVPPLRKLIVPVGVAPVTVAVKVTDWVEMEGLTDEVTAVVVAGLPFSESSVTSLPVPPV